jgi:hypothetical protein
MNLLDFIGPTNASSKTGFTGAAVFAASGAGSIATGRAIIADGGAAIAGGRARQAMIADSSVKSSPAAMTGAPARGRQSQTSGRAANDEKDKA